MLTAMLPRSGGGGQHAQIQIGAVGFVSSAACKTRSVRVKLLPLGRGEPEYRIKNPREEHERVVRESELKPADDGTTNA